MKATYYGHSCFAVETAGHTLLFDPFITPNELARHLDIHKVRADFILISHGHFDHLADAVALAQQTRALVIANYEITVWLGQQGVTKTHPLNHGGGASFAFGRAKFTPAIHSSGLPDGTYGGNPGGFLIEMAAGAFYYAGDTALTYDMKLIGESARLRFAALPIGDNFTMGVGMPSKPPSLCNATRFSVCITTPSRPSALTRRPPSRNSAPPASTSACCHPAKVIISNAPSARMSGGPELRKNGGRPHRRGCG